MGYFRLSSILKLVLQNIQKAYCSETWLRDHNESTYELQNPTPINTVASTIFFP